jgi:hypothetical protein
MGADKSTCPDASTGPTPVAQSSEGTRAGGCSAGGSGNLRITPKRSPLCDPTAASSPGPSVDRSIPGKEPAEGARRLGLRVSTAHHIARRAFALSGICALAAWIWALAGLVGAPGSRYWWGPLHLFMAGTVVLAISGATQMFTITWAAAPVGDSLRPQVTQRRLAALGAASVATGVTLRWDVLTLAGGLAVLASLVLLGVLLRSYVGRSLLKRYDLGTRFYILALTCGAVGVTLGVYLAVWEPSGTFSILRNAHMHLNLIGLVGFVIAGTLPTFLPTLAHHKAVSGKELIFSYRLLQVGALALVLGLLSPRAVGLGTFLYSASLGLISGSIVSRLKSRLLEKKGMQAAHVIAGTGWLVAWAAFDGLRALLGGQPSPPFRSVTLAAAVGGVGQVLAGSVGYLVPVLIGPSRYLISNIAHFGRQPAISLVLANGAALAWMAGSVRPGAVLALLWAADIGRRLATVERKSPDQTLLLP